MEWMEWQWLFPFINRPGAPPIIYRLGRAMIQDGNTCSLHRMNDVICNLRLPPYIHCYACDATHYCSDRCVIEDAISGYHRFLHLRLRALGPALPIHLPYILACELRTFATQKALDMLLNNQTDLNRPMIPALYYQLGRDREALMYITAAIQFPQCTQVGSLQILTEGLATFEQVMHIVQRQPVGLAYAAIITLIKLDLYRDMKFRYRQYRPMIPSDVCSALTMSCGQVARGAAEEAKRDLERFITAVLAGQEDFWERLLRLIYALDDTRKAFIANNTVAIEAAVRSAESPEAPMVNAVSWAFPA